MGKGSRGAGCISATAADYQLIDPKQILKEELGSFRGCMVDVKVWSRSLLVIDVS